MNGHSTAVVKAQLSSRHTFSGKNNRTEITSPSQPANRTPAPESALPFNGRFLKRSAFWKPSATLPVFGGPGLPFPFLFRHGLSGESLRQNRCQFSFHFHFIYITVFVPPHAGVWESSRPPPGNTSYILYQVSLVHKKKQFLVILDTVRRKTFIKNISPSTQHPLLRVNQGAGHPLSPFPASGAAARFSWLIRRTLHCGSAAARHKAGCRKRYAARKPQQPRTP